MRKLVCLLVLVGACDDQDPVRHLDGGMTDGAVSIDAPTTPQPVTLTVTLDGAPQANVRVYFQNPDSSLIANTLTDASGVATALMPNGGFVTAVNAFRAPVPAGLPSNEVHIFAGVRMGDHLSLANDGNPTQSVMITGAVDSDSSVVQYGMSSPCGRGFVGNQGSGTPPSWSADLRDPCPTTDFIVASFDGGGGIVHWAYAPNTTVSATTNLSAATLTNTPATKTYTLNNADAFGGQMQVRQGLASLRGEVMELNTTAYDPVINTLLSASLKLPNFTNAIDVVDTSGYQTSDAEHHLLSWGPFSTTYTVDVAARALVNVTAGPEIDTTLHQLTWTQAATGATPDFVTAWGYASRSEPAPFGWQFWIAAPYGASVQLPTLPTDVGDFNVGASDSYYMYSLNLGKVPGGYDAVRAHIYDLIFAIWNGEPPTTFVTTATGSAELELWAPRPQAVTRQALRTTQSPRVLTNRHR
jgi:hypothetical protein